MIRPERMRELAIEIAAQRANTALDNTHAIFVYQRIENLDDFAPMTVAEVREAAEKIAELVRTGQATVLFPQLLEGVGDGELIAPPIPMGLAGSPGPITINNPEGWEDSWDRERAADDAAQLATQVDDDTAPAGAE